MAAEGSGCLHRQRRPSYEYKWVRPSQQRRAGSLHARLLARRPCVQPLTAASARRSTTSIRRRPWQQRSPSPPPAEPELKEEGIKLETLADVQEAVEVQESEAVKLEELQKSHSLLRRVVGMIGRKSELDIDADGVHQLQIEAEQLTVRVRLAAAEIAKGYPPPACTAVVAGDARRQWTRAQALLEQLVPSADGKGAGCVELEDEQLRQLQERCVQLLSVIQQEVRERVRRCEARIFASAPYY